MLNIVNTVRIAVAAGNEDEIAANDVSVYHAAIEVVGAWKGMSIIIDDKVFEQKYATVSLPKLGKELVRLAKGVPLRCVMKSTRGPKKPPPKKKTAEEETMLQRHEC